MNLASHPASTASGRAIFSSGLWRNHPIFVLSLGICTALAVTTQVKNALAMSAGVFFATTLNSLTVSLLRRRIPATFRLMAYMLITSTSVIIFDRFLKISWPTLAKELGPYVALIITNCIVMGRAEAFAVDNPPRQAFLDAAGAAAGFAAVLLITAAIREIFGLGTFLGIPVMPSAYPLCGFFSAPPGAFLCLAGLILLGNKVRSRFGGGTS